LQVIDQHVSGAEQLVSRVLLDHRGQVKGVDEVWRGVTLGSIVPEKVERVVSGFDESWGVPW
jgi:hypothetical protein